MKKKLGEQFPGLGKVVGGIQSGAQWLFAFLTRPIKILEQNRRAQVISIFAALIFIPFFLLLSVVFTDVPSKKELRKIQNPIASEVYTADSVLIGLYFIQNRTHVNYEDISPNIINALIATEDVRFFKHGGVDIRSLGRVLVKTILMQNESSGGGSTITQQLAKNLFPRKEYFYE